MSGESRANELWELVSSTKARASDTKTFVASLGEGGALILKEIPFNTLVHKVSALSTALQTAKPIDVGETPRVAVLVKRSFEYLVAVLAVVKSGCAFVPVDPDWPSARLSQLCAEVEPFAAIVAPGTHPAAVESFRHSAAVFKVDDPDAKHLCAESRVALSARNPRNDPPHCYVLYTSGSSGHFKGVLGTVAGLINRCSWMRSIHPFEEDDVVAFTTSTSFVDSLWQMFAPLISGTNMLIVPESILRQPETFAQLVQDAAVTHLVGVPSILRHWKDSLRARRHNVKLRFVVSSGDFLTRALSNELAACLPDACQLLNLYGCTECAADSTYWSVDPDCDQEHRALSMEPAGLPISQTIVAVVRQRCKSTLPEEPTATLFRPCTRDCEGEIWVGGKGLAAGYLSGCTSSNTSAFVTISKSAVVDAVEQNLSVVCSEDCDLPEEIRFFRTRDRGKIAGSGILWVLGRLDFSVKRNGVWIDLNQIEQTTGEHPYVLEAAAQLLPWDNAGQELCVYVVPTIQAGRDSKIGGSKVHGVDMSFSDAILSWLLDRLPRSALPSKVIIVQDLPRSSAGKVARALLQPPSPRAWDVGARERNELQRGSGVEEGIEARVLNIFRGAFQNARVEPNSDFFLLGGTSLAASEIAQKLLVDPAMILAFRTPRKLARAIDRGEGLPSPIVKGGGSTVACTHSLELHCKTSNHMGVRWSVKRRACAPEEKGTKALPMKKPRFESQGDSSLVLESVFEPSRDPDNTNRDNKLSVDSYLEKWKKGSYVECHVASSSNRTLIIKRDGSARWERVESPSNTKTTIAKGENPKTFVELWSSKLSQCVDASPALVIFLEARNSSAVEGLVFGCCHGGVVGCFDVSDGSEMWSKQLGSRADAGLAVTSNLLFVAVASVEHVIFVRLVDGACVFRANAGGVLNSSPVVDPWKGFVWCSSHGKQIIAAAPCDIVVRFSTESPISASVSFDESRNRVYAGCLDGNLLALKVATTGALTSVTVAWRFTADGPIFGSCDVDPASGLVVVVTVNGTVHALSFAGQSIWSRKVEAPVFAPPVLLHDHILVTSQHGTLLLIQAQTGDNVCHVEAHVAGLSRSPVILGSKAVGLGVECTFLLCSSEGSLTAFAIGGQGAASVSILASARVEYEVFSSVVALRGFALFGGRDDRLHCIQLV